MKKLALTILACAGMWIGVFAIGTQSVWAEEACVQTATFGEVCDDGSGSGVGKILAMVLNILTFGVGIAATVGFVLSGYQYMTAQDDAGKIKKAKERMVQIVIGLAIYFVMWGVLEFLLPGGVFGDGS